MLLLVSFTNTCRKLGHHNNHITIFQKKERAKKIGDK